MTEVEIRVLPSLRVTVRVATDASGQIRITDTDTTNSITTVHEVEMGSDSEWFVNYGNLAAASEHTVLAEIVDGDTVVESASGTYTVETTASHSEQVRQTVFDILNAETFTYNDGELEIFKDTDWQQPLSVYEDTTMNVVPILMIKNAVMMEHQRLSPVQMRKRIRVPMVLFTAGYDVNSASQESESYLNQIEDVLSRTKNLNMSALGCIDYSFTVRNEAVDLIPTEDNAAVIFQQPFELEVTIHPLNPNFQ